MKTIVVTGGSGKAGRATVKELQEHGYTVINADVAPPPEPSSAKFLRTDLADFGQTIDILRLADAVVHLAAIPNNMVVPENECFRINSLSTYNVFSAAMKLKLERVVWASSETCLGLPFKREKPIYAPLDEEQPLYPESVYSLTKVLGEEMARQFNRWSGIPFIGLRYSNIMEPHDYEKFKTWQDDPFKRKWNLWGYIDARDAGYACRCALEADFSGADYFIIAANDSVMESTNAELMKTVFPETPIKEGTTDHETLLSIEKAKRVLGFEPKYSWRD